MASPFRHICAVTLVAALLPLTACGSDSETDETEPGDTVAARAGVNTEGAPKAFLMLPSGRLDVRAGEPVESIPADATTEREAREAPEGGAFVPVTWSYQTTPMEKLLPIFGRALPIEMTLVSGDQEYSLAPPLTERDGHEADAYYLAVDGTGEDVELKVAYAGETQKLDLRTGKRSAGRAKSLYHLDTSKYSDELTPCPSEGWVAEGPLTKVAFTCTRSDSVTVPYVDGEWAPEGKSFTVIGVASSLTAFTVFGLGGAGAVYSVVSSKDRTALAGKRPTRVLDEQTSTGSAAGFLVFTLDGNPPKNLNFHRTYNLVRTAKQGEIDAPYERRLDIKGTIPLR